MHYESADYIEFGTNAGVAKNNLQISLCSGVHSTVPNMTGFKLYR